MEKQEILDQIEELQPKELAQYIRTGKVSFEELQDTGDFPRTKQSRVKECLEQLANQPTEADIDEDTWRQACEENTMASYQRYLEEMETGSHRDEARERLRGLREKEEDDTPPEPTEPDVVEEDDFFREDFDDVLEEVREIQSSKQSFAEKNRGILDVLTRAVHKGSITGEDILSHLSKNLNWLNPELVLDLISNKVFSESMLCKWCGLDKKVLKLLKGKKRGVDFVFPDGQKIEVSRPSYEVYFWGVPSSGKTCALGGILSTANSASVAKSMQIHSCQGSAYLAALRENFSGDDVCLLPGGTPVDATYVMEFDLQDQKDRTHPITFIDLAGEILRCMYQRFNRISMNEQHEKALDVVTALLKNPQKDYRKLHFFVVDYDGEKSKYEGVAQSTYLDFAVQYIEQQGIFDKHTDGVYILLTKADLMGNQSCQQFLDTKYKAFVNRLKMLCKKHEINGGEVKVFPFTIGKVFFGRYCRFDSSASEHVVEEILNRTQSKIGRGRSWFSK